MIKELLVTKLHFSETLAEKLTQPFLLVYLLWVILVGIELFLSPSWVVILLLALTFGCGLHFGRTHLKDSTNPPSTPSKPEAPTDGQSVH